MKKMFLLSIVGLFLSFTSTSFGQTSTVPQADISRMSKNGAGNPFRPTLEEMSNGITYQGEGVYLFSLTAGEFDRLVREFGPTLAQFRESHPRLIQESMVVAGMYKIDADIRITAYYVTFHENVTFHEK